MGVNKKAPFVPEYGPYGAVSFSLAYLIQTERPGDAPDALLLLDEMGGETMTLEQVVAEWRERANALRMTNHGHDADLIQKVLDGLVSAVPEYLAWLSEEDAMMYEGRRTPDALRDRFSELEARGLAKWIGRRRLYRRAALRHRGNPEPAREAGRRAGRGKAA